MVNSQRRQTSLTAFFSLETIMNGQIQRDWKKTVNIYKYNNYDVYKLGGYRRGKDDTIKVRIKKYLLILHSLNKTLSVQAK